MSADTPREPVPQVLTQIQSGGGRQARRGGYPRGGEGPGGGPPQPGGGGGGGGGRGQRPPSPASRSVSGTRPRAGTPPRWERSSRGWPRSTPRRRPASTRGGST